MITWALAKLGLSLADGKTLMPIAAVLAAAAALIALGLYAVHHFTAAGFDKATAACNAKDAEHTLYVNDEQTRLREASREVIIQHTADVVTIKAAAANERTEVAKDVETNPAPAGCSLSPVGLRIWNRALKPDGAAPLPGGPAAADGDRFRFSDLTSGGSGRSGFAASQPDGLEGSLRDAPPNSARRLGPSQALPAAPSIPAGFATRSTH